MPSRQYEQVFLFDPKFQELLDDASTNVPVNLKPGYGLRYFAILFFLIALPISMVITLLVQVAGYPIWLILPVELAAAFLFSVYYAAKSYRRWHALSRKGEIIYGEIIHSDALPAVNGVMTNRMITRIYYRFTTPEDEPVVNSIDLAYPAERLPDGRKYPAVGTQIVVLYAGKKNHTLL